ncbi:MAG: hypothetical protein AB1428_13105 [Bacteroidota bacterium]
MTIGGVSCGERSNQATRKWKDWVSIGISTSGAVTRTDFGKREYDVAINFNLLPTATVTSLETALQSAKKGGVVAVVPDSGDDLGIGASGSTNLVYMDYQAQYVPVGYWNVTILFKYYA